MKSVAVFVLLASVLFALAEDDGKYRPEEKAIRPIEIPVTPIIRAFPTTTKVPVYKYNDPRYEWNPRRQWPDRYDPRIGLENPRWDGRYNNNYPKPYTPRPLYDYRTIRLDEKVDSKGYRYVYETVGGILAEEVGTFENIGLKTEGVRSQGFVQITEPITGVTYRIDYQTDSKDAYIPRGDGREAPRMPPTIIKLLALLESHK